MKYRIIEIEEQNYELDKFLRSVVSKSYYCRDCIFNHGEGVCFFAYDCIEHNFRHLKKN